MRKILVFSLLLLSACSWFSKNNETAQTGQMCTTGTCPEVLPTKGPKGWPVQNNDGVVWKNVRGGTNFVADKTRNVRREAAKFLVPEDIITNEAEYKQYVDYKAGVETKQKAEKKAFCYKSIGDVNCYSEPIKGEEDRLVQ